MLCLPSKSDRPPARRMQALNLQVPVASVRQAARQAAAASARGAAVRPSVPLRSAFSGCTAPLASRVTAAAGCGVRRATVCKARVPRPACAPAPLVASSASGWGGFDTRPVWRARTPPLVSPAPASRPALTPGSCACAVVARGGELRRGYGGGSPGGRLAGGRARGRGDLCGLLRRQPQHCGRAVQPRPDGRQEEGPHRQDGQGGQLQPSVCVLPQPAGGQAPHQPRGRDPGRL